MPYKFNGKELDEETGLYYYGARYMQPVASIWYGVDPLTEKYPNMGAYVYCAGNPIKLIDPTGLDWVGSYAENGMVTWSWNDNISSLEEAQKAGFADYRAPGSIIDNATINGKQGSNGMTSVYLGYSEKDYSYTWPNSTVTPFEVGTEWLSGKGPRHRDFTNGDLFTEMLKQHDHIKNTIEKIKDSVLSGQYKTTGNEQYSLSGIEGVGKYVLDYSTLFSFGLTGNLAVTYLGSYNLNWEITNMTKDSMTIQFIVKNTSTIQSGTRPPVLGYTEWWKNGIGAYLNDTFQTGPMSKTSQTFIWTENVKFK